MVERLLVGLLTGGHILLEGVPGLAKTLAVRTLAEIIHASFSRIQFTPDLLPADVIGTMVFDQKSAEFSRQEGPALRPDHPGRRDQPGAGQGPGGAAGGDAGASGDHRRRRPTRWRSRSWCSPPRTRSSSEGTYPLPEAQLDRFMLKVRVGYPTRDEEKEILLRMSGGQEIPVERLLDPAAILAARQCDRRPVHGPKGGGLHRRPDPGHARSRGWWASTTSSRWLRSGPRPALPLRWLRRRGRTPSCVAAPTWFPRT